MLGARVFRGLRKVPMRFQSTAIAKMDASIQELPLREAVRYKEKNLRWTAKEFSAYSSAHANALADNNFKPGETVAIWLPEGAEKHVALTAATKLGLNIVDVDTNLTDVSEVRSFLKMSNCKAIYFQPVHEDHDYLLLLRKAIPEFFEYDDSMSQLFHSKHFPALRLFIHTGFDIENGCITFKSLFLPHPEQDYLAQLTPSLPKDAKLYSRISKGSGSSGPQLQGPMTVSEAVDQQPSFAFAKKITAKEFFEST